MQMSSVYGSLGRDTEASDRIWFASQAPFPVSVWRGAAHTVDRQFCRLSGKIGAACFLSLFSHQFIRAQSSPPCPCGFFSFLTAFPDFAAEWVESPSTTRSSWKTCPTMKIGTSSIIPAPVAIASRSREASSKRQRTSLDAPAAA